MDYEKRIYQLILRRTETNIMKSAVALTQGDHRGPRRTETDIMKSAVAPTQGDPPRSKED